jgi:cytochrome c oxidase subunit 3
MREQFEAELTPELKEKVKKNLVYASLVSISMVFAGLVSAYIVSMGGSFWLKTPFPTPFFISTACIVLSSITFILSARAAKANNKKRLIILISTTFLLGIGFVVFQFKGYGELVNRGVYASANRILVNEGRYGDYYTLKYKGKYLVVNGNDYLIEGRKVDDKTKEAIRAIGKQFENADRAEGLKNIKGYGTDFVLLYDSEPVAYLNQELVLPDGTIIGSHDLYRLRTWAEHIRDGRGDFFVKGEFGKDFHVYYKSKELNYKNRSLYLGDQKLSPYLLNKAMDSSDTASSYLYVITFLHLLHIVFTLLFMIRTVSYSFLGKYTNGDSIGLRATGIFWHFLGALWIFLLLFLLFIH